MTRYFNRLASRTGLTLTGNPGTGAKVPRFSEGVSSEKATTSTDIEVHKEKVAIANTDSKFQQERKTISSPVETESALINDIPSTIPTVAQPVASTFENDSQSATQLSIGKPLKSSAITDMGIQQPESAVQHTVLEDAVQAQDTVPEVIKSANAIRRQTTTNAAQGQVTPEQSIEMPAARTVQVFQTGHDVQDSTKNYTGITTADLEQHAETANNILEQTRRPAGRTQLNDPVNVIEQRTIKESHVGINIKNPAIKQEVFNHHNTARNSFATQIVKQPVPIKAPLLPKNNIEIKIGKINLEVHQATPVPAPAVPRPMVRQQTAAPQGNNLSRYYLRGL